jgi:EF hand
MKPHILALTSCGFILVFGVAGAKAEESMGHRGQDYHAMMEQGGMGCGMMGRRGMMGGGMMRRGAAMRFIFALMDGDGDGTVSLQEFQAAQEKIFKAMDTDKDGTITLEEIRAFIGGPGKSVTPEQKYEDQDQDQDQDEEDERD